MLGSADPALTDVGARTGATAGARRCPCPTVVVSSPLRRARETAAAFGRPVEIDERWIELDYGEFDGHAGVGRRRTDVWARWRADASFAPPGGESLEALAIRVHAACAELVEAAPTSTVVVVTHVSPIKAAIAWALDVPVDDRVADVRRGRERVAHRHRAARVRSCAGSIAVAAQVD